MGICYIEDKENVYQDDLIIERIIDAIDGQMVIKDHLFWWLTISWNVWGTT